MTSPGQRSVARVVAVTQHVQKIRLRLARPLLAVKVQTLQVNVSLAGDLGELPGVLHEGLLQVPHDLFPDCPLHREMALKMSHIVLGEGAAVVQLLARLPLTAALLRLPFPLITVVVVCHSAALVLLAGADRDGAVCLRVLKVKIRG